MTIEYDDAELSFVGITDPLTLNVLYWDGANWMEVLPCEGCMIDTDNQTVTLVLDHLTEFALVAPAPPTGIIYLPAIMR